MSIRTVLTGQFAVNTTPQIINPASLQNARTSVGLLINNLGANLVFIGNSTVNSTTGYPISNTLPAQITSYGNIYVVTSTGTGNVAVITSD